MCACVAVHNNYICLVIGASDFEIVNYKQFVALRLFHFTSCTCCILPLHKYFSLETNNIYASLAPYGWVCVCCVPYVDVFVSLVQCHYIQHTDTQITHNAKLFIRRQRTFYNNKLKSAFGIGCNSIVCINTKRRRDHSHLYM